MIGFYHYPAAGRDQGKPDTVYRLFSVSGNGIQKADKLLKRSEFINLSKHGKSVHNRYFVVVFQPNQSNRTRLGITVTKKIGNAVTRNRIKRIVRESFRLNRHLIKENRDINVIAKKAAADATGGQAIASLRALFEKMGGV